MGERISKAYYRREGEEDLAPLPATMTTSYGAFTERARATRASADTTLSAIDRALANNNGTNDPAPPDARPVESRPDLLEDRPVQTVVLGAVALDVAAIEHVLKTSEVLLGESV